LSEKKEATALFDNERDHGFQGILGNIEQTFGGEPLYKTLKNAQQICSTSLLKITPLVMAINASDVLFFYCTQEGITFVLN
jgi:hypothetical protein